MSKVTNQYNDDAIQVLEGLEAVRKRPRGCILDQRITVDFIISL